VTRGVKGRLTLACRPCDKGHGVTGDACVCFPLMPARDLRGCENQADCWAIPGFLGPKVKAFDMRPYPAADAGQPISVVGRQRAFLLAMRPSRSSALKSRASGARVKSARSASASTMMTLHTAAGTRRRALASLLEQRPPPRLADARRRSLSRKPCCSSPRSRFATAWDRPVSARLSQEETRTGGTRENMGRSRPDHCRHPRDRAKSAGSRYVDKGRSPRRGANVSDLGRGMIGSQPSVYSRSKFAPRRSLDARPPLFSFSPRR
jgi:hypothetical protein